jgi:hypothetical protein
VSKNHIGETLNDQWLVVVGRRIGMDEKTGNIALREKVLVFYHTSTSIKRVQCSFMYLSLLYILYLIIHSYSCSDSFLGGLKNESLQ